jgi:hypothetical protein
MRTNRDNLTGQTPDLRPKIACSVSAVALTAAHRKSGYEDCIAPPTGSLPKLAHSVADAAYMSGLSRSSLYLAIRSGALPAKKCGRRTLILHESLLAFLRAL